MFEFDPLTVALGFAVAVLVFFCLWQGKASLPVVFLTPVAILVLFVFGFGYENHQTTLRVQRLQAQVTDKYRVEFYPGRGILTAGHRSIDVIGFVDGEQRGCSLRFKSKTEPLVFCGAGVEADRAS